MNATQMKYLRERAISIRKDKEAKIRKKYRGVYLDDAAKARAFKAGRYTLVAKPPKRIYYASDILKFDDEILPDEKARDREMDELGREFTRLIDRIVLGDETQAVEMLEAFAA